MPLTAVLVDDEPLASAHLGGLLKELGITVSGVADTAAFGLQLVEDLHPDLLFLDIQMPGMTGMQMADLVVQMFSQSTADGPAAERQQSPPMIVFVTGYSEYAVNAFERNALDYLVKPVSSERLSQTVARARERSAEERAGAAGSLVQAASAETPQLRRLPIRDDYAVRLIKLDEILYAEAREKRVYVHVTAGEYRTYYTLKQLETMLPPTFFRVHDSYVVNLEVVDELLFLGNHAYEIRLSSGRMLPVSRGRFTELQRRLGVQ
jgi:DNA-binding LytR/AlgR family response regulator